MVRFCNKALPAEGGTLKWDRVLGCVRVVNIGKNGELRIRIYKSRYCEGTIAITVEYHHRPRFRSKPNEILSVRTRNTFLSCPVGCYDPFILLPSAFQYLVSAIPLKWVFVRLQIIFYFYNVVYSNVLGGHMESVFALSLHENVAVFNESRTTNSTHFLFRLWQRDTFSVPIPHIYSSVGYCVVYLIRVCHNLHVDKRNQLHTFFLLLYQKHTI